jgi:hypothetical protein
MVLVFLECKRSAKNRITYAILSEKELRIMRILLAEDEADLNQIITRKHTSGRGFDTGYGLSYCKKRRK